MPRGKFQMILQGQRTQEELSLTELRGQKLEFGKGMAD